MLKEHEGRTAEARPRVLVARLHGGPFDGWEDWIFRLRTDYLRRVPRGRVARALDRPPRYAWYQLVAVDEDGGHAEYAFRGIRQAAGLPLDY